nr:calcium uniporter protein 4, mitochondrial-like [Ipomoea batatas]GME10180.1 calcium uniporter protein 4, mitochondrial-like [Ipomoea batatas]
MALRKTLTKRLLNCKNAADAAVISSLQHSPAVAGNRLAPESACRLNFHRELLTSPDGKVGGFFRRFLHRRAIIQAAKPPEFASDTVGDKLREKLWPINISSDRLRLDGLVPPPPVPEDVIGGISVTDARKILRSYQLQKVRLRIREIPVNSVSYSDFVQICSDSCNNREQGLEFAKTLDQSGSVIVLGDVVLLRPDKVAKSMEKMISESIAMPNDPRRNELEAMEKQKAMIDQKARSLVRGELYCGLGFLALQTLGFMRLTFWELSWDVMEPICFFVTTLHFGLAYSFFLRTSKEPSFEGYFQRRFKTKQQKLMKIHNFDVEKYNKLRNTFYQVGDDYHHVRGVPLTPA